MKSLNVNWDQTLSGNHNWMEQFMEAIYVNGSKEGMRLASMQECIIHFFLVPWKFLVAFVPPTDFCAGWLSFYSALVFIGIVTAIISDMASLLGCVLDLPDSITAITFVALGTSLPDTFASRSAAMQDQDADASVGNVTGSNSVNVFLGLGLPWTLGSVYWEVVNGATNECFLGVGAAMDSWLRVLGSRER